MTTLIQLLGALAFAVGVLFTWVYWPPTYSISEFNPRDFAYSAGCFLAGLSALGIMFGFADLIQSGRDIRSHLAAIRGVARVEGRGD